MDKTETTLTDKYIFRPLPRRWGENIAFITLSFALLTVYIEYKLPDRGGWIYCFGVWLIFAVIDYFVEIRPLRCTRFVIGKDGFLGNVRKTNFEIHWKEIVAANLLREPLNRKYSLWVATANSYYLIPLEYLDAKDIWKCIQGFISAEITGDQAYKKWYAEQIVNKEYTEKSDTSGQGKDKLLLVKVAVWYILICGIGIVFFSGFAVLSFKEASWILAFVFSLFSIMCILVILPDSVEIDGEKLARKIWPIGRFEMRWDKVEWIEHNGMGDYFILYSKGKRLPLGSFVRWNKVDKNNVKTILEDQIRHRKIEIRTNPNAQFIVLPKN